MVVDIHKMITSNKITSNLMKPWGSNYGRKSNSKSKSLREKTFNKYTGPGNTVHLRVDFNPKTGDIYIRFTINNLLQMIVVLCIMILNIQLLKILEKIMKILKD